jgi:predicted nucleic acid-binding protein
MTGLLDINVILDVLLNRQPFVGHSRAVWQACDDGRFEGYICAASLPTIFYIVRRTVGLSNARESVAICLEAFQICPVDREALELANAFPGSDFEDNLQIACAHRAGLDSIITRDPRGLAHPQLAVLTPSELISRLP